MNCTHFKLIKFIFIIFTFNVKIYCCLVAGNWVFWSATVRSEKKCFKTVVGK